MQLKDIKKDIPIQAYCVLEKEIEELRPCQEKSIKKGLLERKNILVCTPTASGKTLCAELVFTKIILEKKGKAVYVVPLKALASEKFKEFKRKYPFIKTAMSIGDIDSSDPYLVDYDLIITTSEKFDSLIRHKAVWLNDIALVVIDEIHLLNDPGRGPTLEIVITILRKLLKNIQIVGLSATIGNPKQLAKWLDAELVEDNWRPVKLHKGIYLNGKIEFE